MRTGFLLSPLELVLGRPLGTDPDAPPLPHVDRHTSPLKTLEDSVRSALERPPCVVLFSGGRDSSGLLAVATRVSRRLGTEPPIPLTFRFPGVAGPGEDEWQEQVVRHLHLREWARRDIHDELDLLGPHATRVLLDHGPVWPPNAFTLAAAADDAKSGSVITGSFGDEMFDPDPRLVRLKSAGGRHTPRRVRRVLHRGLARSPSWFRRRVAARRYLRDEHLPSWVAADLLPEARATVADELARIAPRWDTAVIAAWHSRYTQVVRRVLEVLADDGDITLVAPFGDPRFRVTFARLGGAYGFESRTAATQALFHELLPEAVLQRSSKAVFRGVFWNRRSYDFARRWTGEGLSPSLVDIDVLQQIWSWDPEEATRPDFRSAALFQAAWLAGAGRPTPISVAP